MLVGACLSSVTIECIYFVIRVNGPDPGRHGRDPAERHGRDEHDDDAERGEETELLHYPHVHGRAGRRAAHGNVVVPQRAEYGPQREPGAGRRGQQRAEQRDVPAGGNHQQEAAEDYRRAGQDLQPQPGSVVGPGGVRRVGEVEIRSDEGDECAPQPEQDQQESAESSSTAPHLQHPSHGYHFPSESRLCCAGLDCTAPTRRGTLYSDAAGYRSPRGYAAARGGRPP